MPLAIKELSLTPSSEGRLGIQAHKPDQVIELIMTGYAELAEAEGLKQVLTKLHDRMVRDRDSLCRVNMQQLAFMSSANFKQFVSWMSRIEGMPQDQRYRVEIVSDPASRWQRTSLTALSTFAIGILSVV